MESNGSGAPLRRVLPDVCLTTHKATPIRPAVSIDMSIRPYVIWYLIYIAFYSQIQLKLINFHYVPIFMYILCSKTWLLIHLIYNFHYVYLWYLYLSQTSGSSQFLGNEVSAALNGFADVPHSLMHVSSALFQQHILPAPVSVQSDLLQNLLGITDRSTIDQMLDSPNEAATMLGIHKSKKEWFDKEWSPV